MRPRQTVKSVSFFEQAKNYVSSIDSETLISWNQKYNMFVAAAVTIGYFNNPDASFTEYGFDVALHVFQAFVSQNAHPLIIAASFATNPYRLFNIFDHAVKGDSTIPYVLNGLDLLNHASNIASSTIASLKRT